MLTLKIFSSFCNFDISDQYCNIATLRTLSHFHNLHSFPGSQKLLSVIFELYETFCLKIGEECHEFQARISRWKGVWGNNLPAPLRQERKEKDEIKGNLSKALSAIKRTINLQT